MESSPESEIKNSPAKEHWEKIGMIPHHGIAIPLFSLKSTSSLGIGEYGDLPLLIDLVESVGMDVIQLLPLNDCGIDPSPYNAISSTALNPLYLSLHKLPFLQDFPELIGRFQNFKKLIGMSFVNYPVVRGIKIGFLEEYLNLTSSQFTTLPEYQAFLANNPFLYKYALFCFLKKKHNNRRWTRWDKPFISLTLEEISLLIKGMEKELTPYLILQYLCFIQLNEAKKYAEKKGVFLKGDIPILLSQNSAEVWAHSSWFDLSKEAGAPPDTYAIKGQNWHFPLFNWEIQEKTGYRFWKERLGFASYCFHLYRIDHVVGLFRIWGIEKGKPTSEGKFIPENPLIWEAQGDKILKMMLASSPLLPIAEDLGIIPEMAYTTLKKLGICGTKVLRWQRYYQEDSRFIPLAAYPPLSLTTTGTHDSDPLKLWWQRYPQEAIQFCKDFQLKYTEQLSFDLHLEILKMSHATPSIFHINPLQDYLTLFEDLSHPKLEQERINIPGTRSRSNWSYRIRPTLEELGDHKRFFNVMEKLVKNRK